MHHDPITILLLSMGHNVSQYYHYWRTIIKMRLLSTVLHHNISRIDNITIVEAPITILLLSMALHHNISRYNDYWRSPYKLLIFSFDASSNSWYHCCRVYSRIQKETMGCTCTVCILLPFYFKDAYWPIWLPWSCLVKFCSGHKYKRPIRLVLVCTIVDEGPTEFLGLPLPK